MANGHGGKRNGAGRKNGSTTKRTAAVKVEAVARGLDPAEVLQEAMELHYNARNWDKAVEVANDLMPYRHPKRAAITVTADVTDYSTLPDE